jgi:hypothetical protein
MKKEEVILGVAVTLVSSKLDILSGKTKIPLSTSKFFILKK